MKKYSSYKSYPKGYVYSNTNITKLAYNTQRKIQHQPQEPSNKNIPNSLYPKNSKLIIKDKENLQPLNLKIDKSKTKHQPKQSAVAKILSEKILTKVNVTNYSSTIQTDNNVYKGSKSPRGNLAMNSPKSQTNLSYINLKEKIHTIAGKLQEIKKDYQQTRVQKKRKDKNKLHSPLCKQNPTTMITTQKENHKNLYNYFNSNQISNLNQQTGTDKLRKNNYINTLLSNRQEYKKTGQSKTPRTKQDNSKSSLIIPESQRSHKLSNKQEQHREKSPIRLNGDRKLSEYVTSYDPKPVHGKRLTQCTSQSNILKPKHENNKNQYYIGSVIEAFMKHSPNSFDQLCRSHIVSSIDILKFMKEAKIISIALSNPCKPLRMPLLKPNRAITIVFDLDQTLIHCNQSTKIPCDIILPIKFPGASTIKAGINIRPYAIQCLKQLSRYFELMVFTASHQFYANVIIDHLDPKNQFISHRLFRDSCYKTQQGFYVKDLRVIDRDLKSVLLVDNAAYSYGFQPENGIPIIPFYENKADFELKNLVGYIKGFLHQNDVRKKNSHIFSLQRYTTFNTPDQLINQLYL